MADIITFPGYVRCVRCGKTEASVLGNDQALDLAATADKEGVFGHYGSNYDNVLFTWTKEQLFEGSICDDCIKLLLGGGHIQQTTEVPEASC